MAAAAVIPVALKADGSLKAASKTASAGEFEVMSAHAGRKIEEAGREIFAGNTAVRPYMLGDKTGCDYCPYHTVCGFDPRIPGFSYRKLEKFDDADEILRRMKEC